MAYIKIHRVPDGTRCFGYMRVEFTLTNMKHLEAIEQETLVG